jgi:hypothetical protein
MNSTPREDLPSIPGMVTESDTLHQIDTINYSITQILAHSLPIAEFISLRENAIPKSVTLEKIYPTKTP